MSKKIMAIIQARTGSERLHGKSMMLINDQPMLYHVLNQVKNSQLLDDIVVATTLLPEDDQIENFCKNKSINCFRGSEEDVLDRYYRCSKEFDCVIVVRICADCPLIDPKIIDMTIKKFLENSYDYVSTNVDKVEGEWINSTCNFPQGMTVEISSIKTLEEAWKKAKKPSEREHVFPYVQFNDNIFRISNIKNTKDLSYIRCTVDTEEDLKFVREIFKRLPKKTPYVKMDDIIKIVTNEPHLVLINGDIRFDEGYKKSLLKDNNIVEN